MEHAQIQSSDGTQVMTINGQQLQVLQMNNSPHMIQGPNGQQIVVHAVPSNGPSIQVIKTSSRIRPRMTFTHPSLINHLDVCMHYDVRMLISEDLNLFFMV